MAYGYETMGNNGGNYETVDPGIETEEQRRLRLRREAEQAALVASAQQMPALPVAPVAPDMANTEVQSQTVKTYGDGSQEEITKRQIPVEPQPVVAPSAMPMNQLLPMAAPGVMTSDSLRMAQNTAAGPQPAEQTDVAQQLQSAGIEPTEKNIKLVNMLGMSGATRYIQKQMQPAEPAPVAPQPAPQQQPAPQPAPVAPASNANTLRAAQNAAAGNMQMPAPNMSAPNMPAPAVDQGPMGPPQPLPGDTFESKLNYAGNDFGKLSSLYNMMRTPVEKQLIGRILQDNLRQQIGPEQAKQELAAMNELDIARLLKSKSEEGSYTKMLLLSLFSPELAGREAVKLGLNATYQSVNVNGQPVLIKTRGDGVPMEGYSAVTGKQLNAKELVAAAAMATAIKGSVTHTGKMQDVTTGEVYYERTTPQGIQLVDNNGKIYTGSSSNLRPFGIGSDINTQQLLAVQKQNIELAGDWAKLQMKIQGAGPEAANRYLGEFNAKYQTSFPLSSISGSAPQIDAATGRMSTTPAGQAAAAPVVQTPAVDQAAVARAQGDVAAIDREIKATPANQTQRLGILQNEKLVAQQRLQSLGGTPAEIEINKGLAKKQGETNIDITGKRSESFNKILDEEIRPQAQAGDTVSSVRKQQFAIFDRPGVDMNKIFGLATGAGRSAGDQSWTMLRDVLLGTFTGKEDDIKQRAAALGLNPDEASALAEYQTSNVAVNAANLKKTAGPGSVSDAEQKVNREAGMDPTKNPALAAYNIMSQGQFDADKQRYKADWATTSTATNALELDKQWRQESQRLTSLYADIARERTKFIASQGSTTAVVKEGYKRYPIPEYDPQSGSWKKTRPMSSFNR